MGQKNKPQPSAYVVPHFMLRNCYTHLLNGLIERPLWKDEVYQSFRHDFNVVMDFAILHVVLEEKYIHPLLAKANKDFCADLDSDHKNVYNGVKWFRQSFEDLGQWVKLEASKGDPSQGVAKQMAIYHRFAQYMGEEFQHLALEEEKADPLLREVAKDEEIMGIVPKVMLESTEEQWNLLAEIFTKYLPLPLWPTLGPVLRNILQASPAKLTLFDQNLQSFRPEQYRMLTQQAA